MYLCLVFLMLLHLFIAAMWSPAGKGLFSWLLLVMFFVFLLLSHVVSLVWYLIVSFHDLCRLSYFEVNEPFKLNALPMLLQTNLPQFITVIRNSWLSRIWPSRTTFPPNYGLNVIPNN